MRKSLFITSFILLLGCLTINAQELTNADYTLEIISPLSESPIKRIASISSKGSSSFISIQYPQETKTAQIVIGKTMEIKFLITDIENNALVSTQFIGFKNEFDNILGTFNIIIDGILQVELSGSFKLIKYKDQMQPPTQNRLGGHIGVVHGLFTLSDGEITSIVDSDYSIGFPMGITVKKRRNFAFDLEMVPSITFLSDTDQDKIDLLIHPGLLWGISKNITLGARLAFELGNQGRYGFTPLLNFGNIFPNGFVEVVLPIRFSRSHSTAVTLGIHIGTGF